MERITKNSPTHEKLLALIKVQAALTAIQLVDEIGLGSRHLQGATSDLKVYEGQLMHMMTNETKEG